MNLYLNNCVVCDSRASVYQDMLWVGRYPLKKRYVVGCSNKHCVSKQIVAHGKQELQSAIEEWNSLEKACDRTIEQSRVEELKLRSEIRSSIVSFESKTGLFVKEVQYEGSRSGDIFNTLNTDIGL